MSKINIYDVNLVYWKGMWSKGPNGKPVVVIDPAREYHEAIYTTVPAKSIEQLVYILSKKIQAEKNLSYPVYIDVEQLRADIVDSVPEVSERFENLEPKPLT